MRSIFWLNDEAWSVIEPLLPRNQPGARRVDDRRVISGIVHVLRRVATRYDKLARTFLDAVTLAAIYAFQL